MTDRTQRTRPRDTLEADVEPGTPVLASDGEAVRGARQGRRNHDAMLRWTGLIALASLVLHGADHVRRGTDVVTTVVTTAGAVGFLLAVIAVLLVFRRHRWAPHAAIVIGFPTAVRFSASHLLPHWSAFSDPFVGSDIAPRVTAFSWATAVVEISALLAFGAAGVLVLRDRRAANSDADRGAAVGNE